MSSNSEVKLMDYVKAEKFYQDAGDKIKLNWFCYEYANNLYMAIRESDDLSKFRGRRSQEDIAAFCLYFAKRMRKSIYDMQTGKTEGIAFRDSYVFTFYAKINQMQADLLLKAAISAWDEQLSTCGNCSSKCLTEGFELCAMFDRLKKTGWPI